MKKIDPPTPEQAVGVLPVVEALIHAQFVKSSEAAVVAFNELAPITIRGKIHQELQVRMAVALIQSGVITTTALALTAFEDLGDRISLLKFQPNSPAL